MERTVDTALVAGSSGSIDMSVMGLFLHADWIVKLVIMMLLLSSIWSWAIIIEKFFVNARGLNRRPSWYCNAKIGMNEIAITNSEKKLGPPTSFTASMMTCVAEP